MEKQLYKQMSPTATTCESHWHREALCFMSRPHGHDRPFQALSGRLCLVPQAPENLISQNAFGQGI